MCGPLMFYHDYISFIKGAHVESMLKEQAALLNGNNNISSRFASIDVEKINPWVYTTCQQLFFPHVAQVKQSYRGSFGKRLS